MCTQCTHASIAAPMASMASMAAPIHVPRQCAAASRAPCPYATAPTTLAQPAAAHDVLSCAARAWSVAAYLLYLACSSSRPDASSASVSELSDSPSSSAAPAPSPSEAASSCAACAAKRGWSAGEGSRPRRLLAAWPPNPQIPWRTRAGGILGRCLAQHRKPMDGSHWHSPTPPTRPGKAGTQQQRRSCQQHWLACARLDPIPACLAES